MAERPLLRGKAAAEATAALRRISRVLIALPPRSAGGPSLADGNAGLALAHAALDPLFPRAGHLALAEKALDRSINALSRTEMSPSLFSGFAGIAWAEEHLRGHSGEDANEAIDDALLLYLTRAPWTDSYDLINGLVGIGVYALERLPRAGARRILELVVERLAETARRQRPGLAWWSDPAWVPAQYRPDPPFAWNLGVAHGVPGVIVLLAGACRAGIATRAARRLLDGAVRWLLAQEIPGRVDAGFAFAVGPGLKREPARTAWCYGDPGVAAALLAAGCAVEEPAWKEHALRIALRASARSPEVGRVIDASLCHGAAGLGHLYHRMYLATGDPRLARAARSWLVRTLGFRRKSGGIAGFASWGPDKRGRLVLQPDLSLLTGIAGIALALASALIVGDPTWDRMLLLSLRMPPTPPDG
jgi:lantibiotic biosynthesis protein